MTISLPDAITKRITSLLVKKHDSTIFGPVGIDLGPNGLRLVQFRKAGGKVELNASAFIHYADEARKSVKQTRSIIRKALREHEFVGREIVTCLQPEDAKIMMLTYTHQSGKEDENVIVQRIAERVDDEIESLVIDYMMVRPDVKDGQERSVLIAVARRERVIDYLEHLRKAGLVVRVLEIEPTAVRRLVSVKHINDKNANLMTVSIGQAHTSITVLSGRRLIYERDIDFGEIQLIELLCRELDLKEREARKMLLRDNEYFPEETGADEESSILSDGFYGVLKPMFMGLVENINSALVYTESETRGMPVKHVYLTNMVASWRGIESFVGSLINVPVSVLRPFEGFANTGAFEADSDPCAAVVTGMALYGMTEVG